MNPILNNILKTPSFVETMSVAQWEMCIRQATASNMTGRLSYILSHHNLQKFVPSRVANHLVSAEVRTRCQHREINFEVTQLVASLNAVGILPIFLKGAAYVVAKTAHQGRTCNDIDILVPLDQLKATEKELENHGWVGESISAYDAKYYRQWMHEIPPMFHLERKTVLDVHHHILPKTNKSTFNIVNALDIATEHYLTYAGVEYRVKTMSLSDMILHSACHLFSEGELEKGLRDLTDIQLMLVEFHQLHQQDSASLLIARAKTLNLEHQLDLATRYISILFYDMVNLSDYRVHKWPARRWSKQRNSMLDWCYLRVITPHHISHMDFRHSIAALVIFVRSHYLKMPLRILIPHLTLKCWHGITGTFKAAD